VQLQFFAHVIVGVVAILPHSVVAATGGDAATRNRALEATVGEAQRLVGRCGADCAAKYPRY